MKRELVSRYSENLDRYMDLVVYGEGGYPVIVFPTQDSPCTNWEDFGMIDTLDDYIGSGMLQLFCVSNVDKDSWSAADRDKAERADLVEAYYRYVADELCPLVRELSGRADRPLLAGCSMGATHAVVFALRRPDLFQGCIALSGVYDAKFFFDGWMNETLYASSPVDFLPNMASDHPYIDIYNKRQLVLCVGRGAWEDDGVRTQHVLDDSFRRLGISAWCDFWGTDVNHDWPWWKKQIRYFLPIVLQDMKKTLAQESGSYADGRAAEPKEEPAPEAEAKKEPEAAPAAEAKPKPEPEAKPAPKPEAKPAPKPEAKPAPKPEAKPKPAPKAEPAPAAKPAPVAKPKAAAKSAPKLAAKPAPKAVPAPKAAPAPKLAAKPAPKAVPAPKPAPAPEPEAKPAPSAAKKPAPAKGAVAARKKVSSSKRRSKH